MTAGPRPPSPLPQEVYEQIYAKVPRLTVEVVIVSTEGVLLARRRSGPCRDLWHLPGGTVRFGEHLTDAVARIAREELDLEVTIDELLGYIEYPSHLRRGLDWPVGVAFAVHLTPSSAATFSGVLNGVEWFDHVPDEMHEEQKQFLRLHGLAV